jgi:FlaA1/EpsC-like NDP-sugar epimerase
MRWQVTRTATACSVAVAAILLVAFAGKVSNTYSRSWVPSWITSINRLVVLERARPPQGWLARNITLGGAGTPGERLIKKLRQFGDISVSIFGIFDDRKTRGAPRVGGIDVLGTPPTIYCGSRARCSSTK